jgi:hypothetical protein
MPEQVGQSNRINPLIRRWPSPSRSVNSDHTRWPIAAASDRWSHTRWAAYLRWSTGQSGHWWPDSACHPARLWPTGRQSPVTLRHHRHSNRHHQVCLWSPTACQSVYCLLRSSAFNGALTVNCAMVDWLADHFSMKQLHTKNLRF